MKKLLGTLTLVALGLAVSSHAYAAPKPGGNSSSKSGPIIGSSNLSKTPLIGSSNLSKTPSFSGPIIGSSNLSKTPITLLPAKNLINQQTKFINLNPANTAGYNLKFGTKFQSGYLYKGCNHYHWTVCRFDVRYGCCCYFDPCCAVWYYWCEPDLCFYPVTYCPYRLYVWPTSVVVQPATPDILVLPTTPVTAAQPSADSGASDMVPSDVQPLPEPIQ
jgi:hypothetical protein